MHTRSSFKCHLKLPLLRYNGWRPLAIPWPALQVLNVGGTKERLAANVLPKPCHSLRLGILLSFQIVSLTSTKISPKDGKHIPISRKVDPTCSAIPHMLLFAPPAAARMRS